MPDRHPPIDQGLGMSAGDLLDVGRADELMAAADSGTAGRPAPSPLASSFRLETKKGSQQSPDTLW